MHFNLSLVVMRLLKFQRSAASTNHVGDERYFILILHFSAIQLNFLNVTTLNSFGLMPDHTHVILLISQIFHNVKMNLTIINNSQNYFFVWRMYFKIVFFQLIKMRIIILLES